MIERPFKIENTVNANGAVTHNATLYENEDVAFETYKDMIDMLKLNRERDQLVSGTHIIMLMKKSDKDPETWFVLSGYKMEV